MLTIRSEKTLVVFWSTLCSHCRTSMPQLKELYDATDRTKFEVVAISLDTSLADWTAFIRENGYTWLNQCDGKSWYGKTPTDYGVYNLPTMYLLNNRKRIISRLGNIEELKQALQLV